MLLSKIFCQLYPRKNTNIVKTSQVLNDQKLPRTRYVIMLPIMGLRCGCNMDQTKFTWHYSSKSGIRAVGLFGHGLFPGLDFVLALVYASGNQIQLKFHTDTYIKIVSISYNRKCMHWPELHTVRNLQVGHTGFIVAGWFHCGGLKSGITLG